jgi:solute carrier family 10 (sodium/bile acid cotransporter), member 7
MLTRLPAILFDAFLLALAATVALAALLPAHGNAAEVVSVAAKLAIALLFFLYGARLSPQQAWHGVRQWRLHLLVLATTFIIFPLLGLAARALVPSVLTIDLYNGLLFLCLVPSTVQSSIAFTSIARGHVSAAIVSASLSNILGVVLTPLLVVLLMNTSGAPRVDDTTVRDIVLQLLLPFGAGQLARPWIAGAIARYAALLKVVDRGSILLVVYTAFSMGMVEGIWLSVDAWRLILMTIVATVLLAVVLAGTMLIGRLARLDRGDAIVLLFCGSKKSLASGLPMALVFFPAATVGVIMLPLMIFHQIQLVVCAVIASRLARDADDSSSASTRSAAGPAVPAPEAGEEP